MKITSKREESRILREEDAGANLPDFDWDAYERLPVSRLQRDSQRFFQICTSSLGYWKTCSLSPCRRAKTCKGFLSEAQTKSGLYQTYFPPCIREGTGRQHAALAEADRLCGMGDEGTNI